MAQDNQPQAQQQTAPPSGPPQQDGGAARNGNGNGSQSASGAPQAQQADGSPPQNGKPSGPPAFTRSPIFRIALVAVVVIAAIWGYNYWQFSQNHVATDDAYVTGDLINVSPIINGTLARLNVEEGDSVKAGQVIAVLDQSGPRATYDQQMAAYRAAMSQIPQARTQYAFESQNVQAQINQARAALNAQQAKTAQSQQQVNLIAATTSSQILQAQAQAEAALAQAQTARAQALSAVQSVRVAESAASAAQQQVSAQQANAVKAQRDAARYAALYGPNGRVAAVTAQQLDAAQAAADSSAAQLQATRDQANQARAQVVQLQAQANAAQASAAAAMKQYEASLAQVRIARANLIQVPVQRFGVANNAATAQQNNAQLQAAIASEQNVQLRKQQISTAQAQADQAKAAAANAQVTLGDTIIKAPSDGVIVRKGANVGDALTAGQTIATMTRGDYVWISANFKETQLQNVRVGEPAEIDVDAYPGKTFHGTVRSINEASGNTTSLLPADNATGNFTKVVQRIPVKIVLKPVQDPGAHDATAQDIHNLRQGMSVEATIDISSARK